MTTNVTKRIFSDWVWPPCSCLDSAFERRAIDDGLVDKPVFPENIEYLEQLRRKSLQQ